uniref:Uncharacterized protein n=1 Tax=Trichuris muris TaxID=70415 RepID=A0A5S6Q793_TRIMR
MGGLNELPYDCSQCSICIPGLRLLPRPPTNIWNVVPFPQSVLPSTFVVLWIVPWIGPLVGVSPSDRCPSRENRTDERCLAQHRLSTLPYGKRLHFRKFPPRVSVPFSAAAGALGDSGENAYAPFPFGEAVAERQRGIAWQSISLANPSSDSSAAPPPRGNDLAARTQYARGKPLEFPPVMST